MHDDALSQRETKWGILTKLSFKDVFLIRDLQWTNGDEKAEST